MRNKKTLPIFNSLDYNHLVQYANGGSIDDGSIDFSGLSTHDPNESYVTDEEKQLEDKLTKTAKSIPIIGEFASIGSSASSAIRGDETSGARNAIGDAIGGFNTIKAIKSGNYKEAIPIIGGFFKAKRAREEKAKAEEELRQKKGQIFDAELSKTRSNDFSDSVNNVVNPIKSGYAYGGFMSPNDVNTFETGGTHESNPNGGIPQGMNDNGQMNTVEENEVSVKLDSKRKYIFSDRLIYK